MYFNFYPSTPKKFSQQVNMKIDNLDCFPYMYPQYRKNTKYRKMIVKNYIIFYKIDNINKVVNVVHIYYAKQSLFNLSS